MATNEVFVYGNKYRISCNDAGLVKQAASYVEETMKQIEKNGHILTTSTLAVMAAIKIAAEYYEVKRKLEDCESKLQELIGRLE
ncbi:MAG: cell division protein ZapA [Calditerrivibrio sp.]|nr:cell division protein ZapA [Calditerrivibrio sp.]